MIHRTAVVISIALMLVMLVATLWRIPMLPDWVYGLNGAPPPIRKPAFLFIIPACVAFVGAVLALQKWLTAATADVVEPWKRWGSHVLVAYGVFCTLFHLYLVSRSVGLAGPFSPAIVARALDVVAGCLVVVAANRMPKLPPLSSQFRFTQLDPVRGAQLLRFGGRFLFLLGLAIIIAAFVMPPRLVTPLVLSVSTAVALAVIVRKVQLLREQSHERLS